MIDGENAPPPKRRIRRLLFKKRWMTAAAVTALVTVVWLAREPIADRFISDELGNRGVAARYRIDAIGFRSERLSNVVIGDPANPDLTAKNVEVLLGYGWSGPYVTEIRADGVRLYGKFVGGRLSFGALDKFRDPTSTDPFALPDLAVVLRDARARVETPWGDVGAALNGGGNLRRDFTGKLALVAPSLAAAGCSGREVSFYGTLLVRNVRPQLVGPLRGRSLTCADGSVAAASPQIALDVSLSEDLQSWKSEADASIAQLVAGPVQADRLGVLARFDGTAKQTRLDVDADMARVRGADFAAETVSLDASGVVGRAAPTLDGRISFAQASGSAAMRRLIAESVSGFADTPIGPLATKASLAVSRILANASGSADFALSGAGPTARVDLIAPKLTSASGARVTGISSDEVGKLTARPAPLFWRRAAGVSAAATCPRGR